MSEDPDDIHLKTVHAVSAGGVAFRIGQNGPEFALIRTSEEGKWQLPKGMIDPGETAEVAALREVREEAGIECELIELIDTIEYWSVARYDGTRKRYHKRVHFFLMKYITGDVRNHDHEVEEASWFDAAAAIDTLAFDNERMIATRALTMIASTAA